LTRSKTDIDPATIRTIATAWKQTDDPHLQKALLKKYTVDELYAIVVEIALQTLNPRQRAEFLSRLTDRLTRG
jgi:hypothetical protein